jgi:membrane protease YdiL (CAAX protease family)
MFKESLSYYLIALVTMPIILVTSYLMIQGFMDLSLESILWPYISKNPLQILPTILYFIVFQGPLGEEIGWRGYLLPELLKKYNFFNASIFLGILWACWHLPKFILPGSTQYLLTSTYGLVVGFIAYMVYTIMLSIMIGYLYLKSGRVLMLALIFHAMANFSHGLIPLFIHGPASLTFMGVMLLLILWIVPRKDDLGLMNEKDLL